MSAYVCLQVNMHLEVPEDRVALQKALKEFQRWSIPNDFWCVLLLHTTARHYVTGFKCTYVHTYIHFLYTTWPSVPRKCHYRKYSCLKFSVNLLPFTSWKPNPNPTHVCWYLFCADSPLAHLVVALSATWVGGYIQPATGASTALALR